MMIFSFNEGAPMKKMKTLPRTNNRVNIPSADGKNTACNKELSRSTRSSPRQAKLLEKPTAVQDKHFLIGVLISER